MTALYRWQKNFLESKLAKSSGRVCKKSSCWIAHSVPNQKLCRKRRSSGHVQSPVSRTLVKVAAWVEILCLAGPVSPPFCRFDCACKAFACPKNALKSSNGFSGIFALKPSKMMAPETQQQMNQTQSKRKNHAVGARCTSITQRAFFKKMHFFIHCPRLSTTN